MPAIDKVNFALVVRTSGHCISVQMPLATLQERLPQGMAFSERDLRLM